MTNVALTQKEVKKRVAAASGGNYVLLSAYKEHRVKVKFKCLKHNVVEYTWPSQLMNGCGCSVCKKERMGVKRNAAAKERFLSDFDENNKHLVLLGEYTKALDRIEFRCSKHGFEGSAFPVSLRKGNGCPQCAYENMVEGIQSRDLSGSKRAAKVRVQNNKSDRKDSFLKNIKHLTHISMVGVFNNLSTPTKFYCSNHNVTWKIEPRVLYVTNGCPQCGFEVQQNKSLGVRKVKIRGVRFKLRGYENLGIKHLLKLGYNINEIETSIDNHIEPILYGNGCRYYPDLRVGEELWEVKSTWTFIGRQDWFVKNKRKMKAAIKQGLSLTFLVFDDKKKLYTLPDNWWNMKFKEFNYV